MKFSKAEMRFDEWAKYADEDRRMVEIALKEDGPPNQICFHSQQIAEKYLKGYLVFHGKEFEKNHLLRYLLELCGEVDPGFRELNDDVIYLTQFYTETRYPGDIPEFDLPECQKAFEAALRIKEFVLSKIKSEGNGGFISPKILIGLALAVLLGGYFAFFYKSCSEIAPPAMGEDSPHVIERAGKQYFCVTFFEKLRGGYTPSDVGITLVPPPAPPPVAVDTSNWKTYRNEEYGFAVRYPVDWLVQSHPSGDGVSFISALAPVVWVAVDGGTVDGEVYKLEASVRALSAAKVISKRKISVDGRDGIQVIVYWPEAGAENTIYTYVSAASRVYSILWTTDTRSNGQINSQFLETFKFIK